MPLAPNDDLHRLRQLDANIFRNPGIKHIRRSDAESNASDGADVRSMRIRPNVYLPRQRLSLEHDRMTDALRALPVGTFAVQLHYPLLRGILLLQPALLCHD